MVVGDLDIVRVAPLPAEAYAVLVVDADRMLTFALALECFEPETLALEIVQT